MNTNNNNSSLSKRNSDTKMTKLSLTEKLKEMVEVNRLYCFFALFCFVYFLESIGGVYMVSAMQSIERQFQIPSKMSGLMISAGDFGYIPTVVIISYLGSKGNRARWIGGGTLLIAVANLLIATPNFIFPVPRAELNLSIVEAKLAENSRQLLSDNATSIDQLVAFRLIADELSDDLRERVLMLAASSDGNHSIVRRQADDESLEQIVRRLLVNNDTDSEHLSAAFRQFIRQTSPTNESIRAIHKDAVASFGFCDRIVNELKETIEQLKCARTHTNIGPFSIIFVALFMLGIGRTMPWSLGVPLIDDNVKRKNLPLYFAGMFFIRILGPILGFSIGSLCNKLYYTLETPAGLSPRDPTWIGAWWLGFIFIACILFGPSLALFLFPNPQPKEVPKSPDEVNAMNTTTTIDEPPPYSKDNNGAVVEVKKKRTTTSRRQLALVDRHARTSDDGKLSTPIGVTAKVRDFSKSILEVLKSPIYTGALFGRILDVMAFKGYMVFLPKYLENHYGMPQYKVQASLAAFGVIGFAIGMALGSVTMRTLKLEGRRAAMFVAVCSLLSVSIASGKIFLGCHSTVNRIGQLGSDLTPQYNYTNECNIDCQCDAISLSPVCDIDGNPYYSACHAGCRAVNVTDLATHDMHFTSCRCIKTGTIVKRDWCEDDCGQMIVIYFGLVIVAGIIGGLAVIPGVLIILRSVPPAHRSISLGFSGFLVSLLATLPSPVIWGVLVDSACLVWQRPCPGKSGSCNIYNPTVLRTRMHVFYGVLRGIALLSDVWVWYFAVGLKLVSDDDEDESTGAQPKSTSVESNLPPALLPLDDETDSKMRHRRHSSTGNNATDEQRSRKDSQSLAAQGARYAAVSQNTPEHLQMTVAI